MNVVTYNIEDIVVKQIHASELYTLDECIALVNKKEIGFIKDHYDELIIMSGECNGFVNFCFCINVPGQRKIRINEYKRVSEHNWQAQYEKNWDFLTKFSKKYYNKALKENRNETIADILN